MIHLLKIDEIAHHDTDGTILWQDNNINNVFHIDGQQYLLQVAFNSSSGVVVPASYYLGLDNRQTLSPTDTLANLSQEPTQFGYTRQPVSSLNGFTIALDTTNNYRATTAVVAFSAVGGTWGPVANLFLATTPNNTGVLLSSAPLDTPRTLTAGQVLTMRISVGLANC